VLAKALDVLFILHADHEQNCLDLGHALNRLGPRRPLQRHGRRGRGGALRPAHGGANEAVVKMLARSATPNNVPEYVERVKRGEFRLMGFGHRVYKNYDPRAKIIKKVAYDVFEVTGSNPLIDVAVALEEVALHDEYFVSAQALSQRRLLQRHHLPGDALPARHVHRALHAGPRAAAGWRSGWN
jgi:citrate synthase